MLINFFSRFINSQFITYVIRCLIGFLIGYLLILYFSGIDLFWALLSIILVISPEENKAKQLTIDRFKSNFLGSLSGLIVFFIEIEDVYKVILGIIVTCVLCRLFDLLNVARSAIVALLIILLEHKGDGIMSPIMRFSSVALGCFIGLAVTLVTSYFIQFFNKNIFHKPPTNN